MKLSKEEIEMQGQIKSKMSYAGETYHRVAPAKVSISKQYLKIILLQMCLKARDRDLSSQRTTRITKAKKMNLTILSSSRRPASASTKRLIRTLTLKYKPCLSQSLSQLK